MADQDAMLARAIAASMNQPQPIRREIKVTVKTVAEETFHVIVDREGSIADFKRRVANARDDMPAEQQKLVFTGNVLDDRTVVKDAGIVEGSHLVVFVSPPPAPVPAAVRAQAPVSAPACAPPAPLQVSSNVSPGAGMSSSAPRGAPTTQPGAGAAAAVAASLMSQYAEQQRTPEQQREQQQRQEQQRAQNMQQWVPRPSQVGAAAPSPPAAPAAAEIQELFAGSGCSIPSVEERGITPRQLQAFLAHVQLRCGRDNWKSRAGQPLDGNTVCLYDVVDYVVKPITMAKKKSYVELVATGPQTPRWFVSHWWGDATTALIMCIAQHCRDRDLGENSPYWICAFAVVQGNAHSGSSDFLPAYANEWNNPASSPFVKALHMVEGTLSVIDPSASCLTRVWCGYEIWMAVKLATPGDQSTGATQLRHHLYDMYTVVGAKAVGLCDGFAQSDMRRAKHWWMTDKYMRERQYPVELAQRGLSITCERMQATIDEDRVHILNCIVGAADLAARPPERHPRYDELNNTVRGRYAAAAWRKALEAGRDMAEYQRSLRASGLSRLELSFDGCDSINDDTAGRLSSGLPASLLHLEIEFNGCSMLSDAGVTQLCHSLPLNMQWLKLDFSSCRAVTDKGLGAVADALLSMSAGQRIDSSAAAYAPPATRIGRGVAALEHLDLSFNNCGSITDSGVCTLANAFPVSLKHLMINFFNCTYLTDSSAAGLAHGIPRSLNQLEIRCARCPELSDQGVQAIASSFPSTLERLTLDFRYAVLLTDASATAIASALPDGLKHLEIDFVQCTNMTSSAVLKDVAGKRNGLNFVFWGKDDFRPSALSM